MRLLLTLVLVAIASQSNGHFVLLPVVSNGQILSPYHYVVQHSGGGVETGVLQHPVANPVSRETLEEQSGEGFLQQIPDISDEQASVDPDDSQVPEVQVHKRPHPSPKLPQSPKTPPRPPTRPLPRPIPVPQPGHRRQPNRPTGEEPNVIFNGPQPDGSYDFSYKLGDQSRSEKSDANGNVQGTYSYTGADGKEVTVTYTAGADKGYIPEGEGLLPPPPANPQDGQNDQWDDGSGQDPQVHQRPEFPEDDSQQHITPVVPPRKTPTKNPHGGGSVDEGGSHKGMPYSYNYDAELSSKTETADDNGNVEGSYTYIDGAGVKRTVTYTVKGDEGFVAKGDIHPDPGTGDAQPPPSLGEVEPNRPGRRPSSPSGGRKGTKGGHIPPQQPITPPPVGKGVKTAKGGASGWDKYPLG